MTAIPEPGWGTGPWGDSPWGTGDIDLDLVSALAVRENVVRLGFSVPPYFSQIGDPKDAAQTSHYRVQAVSGVGIDGAPVRAVSPVSIVRADVVNGFGLFIDVIVDRPFSQYPCIYSVTVLNLVSTSGIPLAPGSTLQFLAVQAGMRSNISDHFVAGRDIANPQTLQALFDPLPNATNLSSSVLGTYQPDGTGDYAADEGLIGYQKRIIRRLFARKNGFAHLLKYGLGIAAQVKRSAKPGLREALASDAEDQIRQEPETVEASVRVVVRGDVTIYQVRAKTKLGDVNMDLAVPKN